MHRAASHEKGLLAGENGLLSLPSFAWHVLSRDPSGAERGDQMLPRFMCLGILDVTPVATLWTMASDVPSVHIADNTMRCLLRIWPIETKLGSTDTRLLERLRQGTQQSRVLC